MRFLARLLILALPLALAAPLSAQERASMRSDEVNMRVGPSEDYEIAWVFHRTALPVKVIRLREGWRLVQDPDGAQGWILARLLSPERTALVIGKTPAALREAAGDGTRLLWNAEPGVVGKLGDCDAGWCEFDVGGRKGWVRQSRLWGAGEP
jgi:SH3-like domain-containing protein